MSAKSANRWVEISVEVAREAVDDLVNFMGRYCLGGAVVEEKPSAAGELGAQQVIVKGFLPVRDEETRHKLEVALLLLSRVSPISEPRITILEAADWAEAWKAFFPPQHIGERTVIVPTWRTYEPRPGEVVIHLDPGMAFGTGLHATTRLCLVAIERLLQPGWRVLDVGTGSGILAIAAALQGAAEVHALDVDPVAVDVARENVALNHVEHIVSVAQGTLGPHAPAGIPVYTGTGWDLLLVNILADTIIAMAEGIALALRPGGMWVASGIIRDRAEDVAQAVQQAGLVITQRAQEEDWIALWGRKD